MKNEVEQLYRTKLINIEQKFHIISEAYSKLAVEVDRKNKIINDLNRVIQILEINVEESNKKYEEAKSEIEKLRVQLDKEMMVKKVYIATHSKSNSLLPLPTSPKVSTGNLALNSQTSITPKAMFEKEVIEKDQSMEVLQKYENLLKSLTPTTSKSSLSAVSSKKEIKKYESEIQSSKLNDLTNYKLNKKTTQPKQSLFTKLQVRPITHFQPNVSSLNEIVVKQNTMNTLTKIWEQRDREIEKMDQLFQSINSKLKEFEQ